MKTRIMVAVLGIILVSIHSSDDAQADGGKRLVLNLITPAGIPYSVGYASTVPDIDGNGSDDPAVCFDVPLFNGKNRQYIGTATDCLSDVTPDGDGLALVGTTIFNLKKGQLVTRGNTTVKPATTTIVTPDGLPITHITGASGQGNAILSGTGRFEDAQGTVRLSGMINLSRLASNGEIAFDCLFVIDLDSDDSDDDSDDDD